MTERGREGEREMKYRLPPVSAPTGPNPQPRYVPDWKLNMQPFAAQTMLQPSNTPGPFFFAFCLLIHFAGSSFFNEWQYLNFQV